MYAEETILSFYLLLTHVYKTYDNNEFAEIFSTRNSSAKKNNRFDEWVYPWDLASRSGDHAQIH